MLMLYPLFLSILGEMLCLKSVAVVSFFKISATYFIDMLFTTVILVHLKIESKLYSLVPRGQIISYVSYTHPT